MQTAETAEPYRDEDLLISNTLAGNQDSFSELIGKYKNQLFDLAFRMVRDRSEAEDVLQDSFLDAYRHLATFNKRSRFSTWVYTIVLNHARNCLRHKKVIHWCSLDTSGDDRDEGYKPPEIKENKPTVDLLAEQQLRSEIIHRGVRALPSQYQDIVNQYYFQDTPIKDIAKQLNRPMGTVKVYLHRARKLLHKNLSRKGDL